jgi:hypothetical protein
VPFNCSWLADQTRPQKPAVAAVELRDYQVADYKMKIHIAVAPIFLQNFQFLTGGTVFQISQRLAYRKLAQKIDAAGSGVYSREIHQNIKGCVVYAISKVTLNDNRCINS